VSGRSTTWTTSRESEKRVADHVPWRTQMREKIIETLTRIDGEAPTDEEIEAVATVLDHSAELCWLGLANQGAVGLDKWDGHDGRHFERRYERELREVQHGRAASPE